MKFEIGREYRDRRGETLIVVAIEEDGGIVATDGEWDWNFNPDGTFFWSGDHEGRPKERDLVEEVP